VNERTKSKKLGEEHRDLLRAEGTGENVGPSQADGGVGPGVEESSLESSRRGKKLSSPVAKKMWGKGPGPTTRRARVTGRHEDPDQPRISYIGRAEG